MADRTIVYRADANSEGVSSVSKRLKASGVAIIDERPDMLLVAGAKTKIDDIVDATQGWTASAETSTPRPDTRLTATRPPDD